METIKKEDLLKAKENILNVNFSIHNKHIEEMLDKASSMSISDLVSKEKYSTYVYIYEYPIIRFDDLLKKIMILDSEDSEEDREIKIHLLDVVSSNLEFYNKSKDLYCCIINHHNYCDRIFKYTTEECKNLVIENNIVAYTKDTNCKLVKLINKALGKGFKPEPIFEQKFKYKYFPIVFDKTILFNKAVEVEHNKNNILAIKIVS